MAQSFDSNQPIYLQLVQRICWQIMKNERQAGEKLPSVREMGVEAGVNPNTVQRTYSELERMEVAEMRRGQGTFVTEDKAVLTALRGQLKQEQIEKFIRDMRNMGFTAEEMVDGLRHQLLSETGRDRDDTV